MSKLHVLILIPFYFCAALALLPTLVVLVRLLRLRIGINPLVYASILGALIGIFAPLASGMVELHAFRGRFLLALVLVSLVFGLLDFALKKILPLPLDEELDHA